MPTVGEDPLGTWEVNSNKIVLNEKEDRGLKTTEDARFYRISRLFKEPFSNKNKDLCVQFSVAHEQNIDCGGGYVKLFGNGYDAKTMDGNTDYEIMFGRFFQIMINYRTGPDYCGYTTSLVHLIFSHNGTNHQIQEEIRNEMDTRTHLHTLILKSDNTYEVLVDNVSKRKGSLEDDWDMVPHKLIEVC